MSLMGGLLPPVVVVMAMDLHELKAGMAEARGEMAETEANTARFGALGKAAFLGLGAAVVGVAVETTKMATNFDADMERINTQDAAGLTAQQMKNLRNSVLDLAGPTAQAPDDLAEAMIHVYGSGMKGSQALDVLRIAAEGATVGHANLTDVTNALDAAIAVGIPGVQNYQQAMGELNAVVGAGDMTMQNLADALGGPMLATVKGYGLNITDVGAALAVFGDRNIRGSEAATELRMATQALAVPAATGKKALDSIGLSMTSLRDDMERGGLKLALNDLSTHLHAAGYNATNAGALITAAFGKKAGGGLNILMDSLTSSTSNFNQKFKDVAESGKNFGQDWAETQDTLQFKLKSLGSAAEALGIKIGNLLIPYVTKFLGWIQVGVGWLTRHKDVLIALGVVVGTVLVAGLVSATASLIEFTAALVTDPIFLVVAAIGALTYGVIYAYQHFAWFRDIVREVGRFFVNTFGAAMRGGEAVIHWFVDGPLAWIKSQLALFAQFWTAHGQQIIQIVKGIWSTISSLVDTGWHLIYDGIIRPGLTTLETLWHLTWGMVVGDLKLAFRIIGDAVHAGTQTFLNTIGLFLDLLTGKWSKLGSDAKRLVGDAISGVARIFSDFAKGAIHLLEQAGKDVIQGLINGIKSMASSVTGVVGDIGHGISSGFGKVLSILSPSRVFYGHGVNIGLGLTNALRDQIAPAKIAAGRLAGAVMSGFGRPSLAMGGPSGAALTGGGMGPLPAGPGGAVYVTNVNVTVKGNVWAERDLVGAIQQSMGRQGGRYSSTYTPYSRGR